MRRLLPLTVLALLAFAAVAVGYPPATLTEIGPNSVKVGGLDCATRYELRLREYRSGWWRDSTTQTFQSAGCPDTTPPPPNEPAPIAGQGYSKVLDDPFDVLNRALWDDHIWYQGAPAANSQYVDSGVLHLVSRASQGYRPTTITTQSSQRLFTRGYFEARMRWAGGGKGAWPAFWLFSYRTATNPSYPNLNPHCQQNGLPLAECYATELDVMDEGDLVNMHVVGLHRNQCGTACGGPPNTLVPSPNWFDRGVDLSADWHRYSAAWTATEVRFYLDDRLISTVPTSDSTNQPMFLLLQNWTGSGCSKCGSTDGSDTDVQVDYVQVWQKR